MKRLLTAGLLVAFGLSAVAAAPFKIGMAGFSFWKTPIDEALATMKTINCHHLCIKDYFLPLDADDAQIADFRAKCKAAGVELRASGPLYISEEKTARKLFEQAKKAGVGTVVVVPFERVKIEGQEKTQNVESEKALDLLEKLVKEYDIRAAIHNHGPDMPKLYPTAEAVMARVANRDRRIGCCLDIGHEQRAGYDPVAAIRKYGDRIYDVHLKNLHKADRSGGAVPGVGGALDIRGVFKALADVNYTGVCHIEYERDFGKNALALAESFGYYCGVLNGLGL